VELIMAYFPGLLRLHRARRLAAVLLASLLAGSAHGTSVLLQPATLDTGLSNVTVALTLGTTALTSLAWQAHVVAASNAPWCLLGTSNGTVSASKPSAVPLDIRRDRSPATGAFSAAIVVAAGSQASTVTVLTSVTEGNHGLFPRIVGESRAFAGVPYEFDARGSLTWDAPVYWVTNYMAGIPAEDQALAEGYEGEGVFEDPDEFSLSLVSKDEHERQTVDRYQRFRVWNSPPGVDANGPYHAQYGTTVTVAATGFDPSPRELLTYHWQFNPPDGPFTPANTSPTATFVCTSLSDFYIVCVVSDTWTGARGSYDAPLGARSIAQVLVSNAPPAAEIAFRSNGTWSAWGGTQVLVATRVPAMGLHLRARITDDDDPPSALSVSWREHPANPLDGLLPATVTNTEVALATLTVPGRYRFCAVGFDGAHEGRPAWITIDVPGVACAAVAAGFQSPLPVWGAFASPGAPGNTNAHGVPDETLATRSDIDGRLYLDRPTGATCSVALERTVNALENEQSNYIFTTSSGEGTHSTPVFSFPVTRYACAGTLLDADMPTSGVAGAQATLVMRTARVVVETTDAGGYSFGRIPKSWPVDAETTASYYFVFYKPGWASLCVKRTPTQVNVDTLDAVFALRRTNAVIALAGTVRSAESGLPVAHATVWFGSLACTTAADGTFVFSNLPPALALSPSSPTHVLVADADGYLPSRSVFNGTATGGVVDLFLEGGDSYVYGRVLDVASGAPLTDGVVATPAVPLGALRATGACGPQISTAALSRSGYFSIRVPGGCPYITITSRGAEQHVPLNRAHTGTQPVRDDIFFVPEPSVPLAVLLLTLRRYAAAPRRGEADTPPGL
jgi:hypothetical protein